MKKLDKDLVQSVGSLFMNKRKQVECKELVNNYMTYYPDTQLPPPKPKKGKKGGKKGKKGKGKGILRIKIIHKNSLCRLLFYLLLGQKIVIY